MSVVLKWQCYREFRVLCKLYARDSRCKLYSRDSRYSEYASGSQCIKILNVSGILIYCIFTGCIGKILNISRVLKMSEF